MRGKVWKSVVGGTICTVMALGTVYAGEGEGNRNQDRNQDRKQDRDREHRPEHAGHGKDKGNRNKRRGLIIEELKDEMERFRTEQESLREEAQPLREKVREAVKNAHKGEGKPNREALKEVVKQFEDEARALATTMTNARIQHHKNIVTILETNKEKMVDTMTRMLLSPRPGKGRGRRGGKGGGRGRGKDEDNAGDETGGDLDWGASPAG